MSGGPRILGVWADGRAPTPGRMRAQRGPLSAPR